jgi:hypothetical protein
VFPVYEKGRANGIGYGLKEFTERFGAICKDHLATGRSHAFAFIFYDFKNSALRRILEDQQAFTKLDRLSGMQLSIFYLHADTQVGIKRFNSEFLSVLGIPEQSSFPCVVFFRVEDENVIDVEIAQLDSADEMHGFQELYTIFEKYISPYLIEKNSEAPTSGWLIGGARFIGLEVVKAAIARCFNMLF